MNKTYHRLILVGLFLYLAGTPALASEPPLTGITIDEELAQLLAQVVPYTGDLLKEKRFLFNLNKLINEDLKEQDEKYKLAAAKLAMLMALAISDNVVDSIEVRRGFQTFHNKDLWAFACDSTSKTCYLFSVREGQIHKIDITVEVGQCAGIFGNVCCHTDPTFLTGLDDSWLELFAVLGREADFPFAASEYTPKIVENIATQAIEKLNLRHKTTVEGIAELARLEHLNHLQIGLIHEFDGTSVKEADAMQEAFFDLFPKLPNLHTIEMSTGPVTVAQMQKLGQCQNLKNLTLTHFSADTPDVFAPLNRLKKLERLIISPHGSSGITHSWVGSSPYLAFADLAHIRPGVVEIHDLPNLAHVCIVGTTQGYTFSFKNLPSLEFLVTDAPQLEGDIFTERTPPNLRVLICAGLAVTEEQMRHIATLEQLKTLALYGLRPTSLNVFMPFQDMKALKNLSLFFKTDQYRNQTLTTPPTELSLLDVRFPGGHHSAPRTNLRIPKLAVNCNLSVRYVTVVGDLPPFSGNILCDGVTMSYNQFRSLFTRTDEVNSLFRWNTFTFRILRLTNITDDNLFVGFAFPHELNVAFDSLDTNMRASLMGKTLLFEKCDKLARLNLSGLPLPNVDVRVSELKSLRSYQVSGN